MTANTTFTDTINSTPFLYMLESAMAAQGKALYATGDFAYCAVTKRQLPRTIEIKGEMSVADMAQLCKFHNFDYSMGTSGISILHNEKRFVYTHLHAGSIEADTKTRDFTINALYIELPSGTLHDPCNAISHIESKCLKTTIPADESFKYAPIRIMQAVKLCCEHNYSVEESMESAGKANSHLLCAANADAIRTLLFSILMSDTSKAYEGMDIRGDKSPVLRGLLMLRRMDVFAAIIPELETGRGVEQKKRYHIYDVQEHMLHTCSATPPRLYMRVAGLLHDIGKPEAYRLNNGKNMHSHDRIGSEMAKTALRRLHCKEDFTSKVCRIIAIHMYDIAGIAKSDTLRKRFAQWGYVLTQDIIDFRFSDVYGSGCPDRSANSAIRFKEIFEQMKADDTPFSIYELKITGKDIAKLLNLHTGTEINDVKRLLLRHCAVNPTDNEPEKLLALTTQLYEKNSDKKN